MRHLNPGVKPLAPPREDVQSARRRRFCAAFEKPLQADANPQERNPTPNRIADCRRQTGVRQHLCRLKMTDPRQDHLLRLAHDRRIRGNHGRAAKGIQSLHHGREIARLVIDDCDHNRPLVLGSISPNCLSREQATRSARAKALNRASILWWLERPYMVRMCTLALAPRAKPSKKSSTSSLCKSPTRRFLTFVLTLHATRPLRSMAATPRVSSIGIRKYPARKMPFLSPNASPKASPSAMPTSSTV